MNPFMRVLSGFRSLLVGMGVTAGHFGATVFGRKAVTETYPHQKPTMPEALRSVITFRFNEEMGTHDCNACGSCVRACPSACITVEGHKVEGLKKKRPTLYEVDFASCSLCGLCIDACPTTCLEYSRAYDDAGYEREWKFDLLADYRDSEDAFIERQRAIEAKEAEEKARKAAARKAAKAAAATEGGDSEEKPARERRRRVKDDPDAAEAESKPSRRRAKADEAEASTDNDAKPRRRRAKREDASSNGKENADVETVSDNGKENADAEAHEKTPLELEVGAGGNGDAAKDAPANHQAKDDGKANDDGAQEPAAAEKEPSTEAAP